MLQRKLFHPLSTAAVALLLLNVSFTVRADEGMWLLGRTDPKAMAVARSLGLELTDQQLYGEDGLSLKDCVVDFSDYCSGVIVSADGLLFTNHHCGFSAIQQLSTPDDDILGNGFVARSREEERPAKGIYVKIWQRTVDVTAEVQHLLDSTYAAAGKKLKEKEKADIYSKQINDILMRIAQRAEEQAKAEGRDGTVCDCKPFYGASAFYLNEYKQYSDVRLVFTVPQCLGKFGGDTDNWMWPRQTADFSVFRIYADSLGQPAQYSPDNVPLHPKRWAKVSLDGFGQGSYCMTIGYPGSTNRYLSSYGIRERVGVTNIPMIQVRGVKQDVWRRWMQADRAIGIKYASKFAQSSNYWKNSQGMNEAVERLGIVREKETREQAIRRWFSADAERRTRFSKMLPNLKQAYNARHDARYAQGFVNETFNRGIEIVAIADLAIDYFSSKTTDERRQQINERMAKLYKDYDPRVDEEVMAALLENYAKQVKPRYLPAFYKTIRKKYHNDYQRYAHDVFLQSRLTSKEKWDELRSQRLPVVSSSDSAMAGRLGNDSVLDKAQLYKDPANIIAYNVRRMVESQISKPLRETTPVIAFNENLLTQAVLEMEMDQPHYSDANFTQRMSFGIVSDYSNAGTHHHYLTTMPSLIEKIETGTDNPDYVVQQGLLAMLKRGDYGRYADPASGQLPLCFLTTNDITGGNSGSPMFNGRGELIGLAFDGNWDALSGDISFDSDLQRCIGVDIRYVMWLIDRWGQAQHLVDEVCGQQER